MIWKYLAVPIVGAVIGYITNWVAVKMLFFPFYEKKLFGYRLPFTPGVIPKGRPRLARAAGEVVEKQLLNEEVMKDVLLSDQMKTKITGGIEDWIERQKGSDLTCREALLLLISKEKLNDIIAEVEEDLSDKIRTKISSKEPAKLLAEKVMEEARSRLADSMIGMFLSSSFLDKLQNQIEEMAENYINENVYPLIDHEIQTESLNLQNKPIRDFFLMAEGWDFNLTDMAWDFYVQFITTRLGDILTTLDISSIVQNKINSMDIEELEEIVLYVMKKELAAVVNIGAIIGFVLGLVNIFIMLL